MATAKDLKETLEIFSREGVKAASAASGLSERTIYRWAEAQGIRSGNAKKEHKCPSAAAYQRGCRCDGCKLANREANREAKRRRVEKAVLGGADVPHGVGGYTNWDCRCATCRGAWSRYLRIRRENQGKEHPNEQATDLAW